MGIKLYLSLFSLLIIQSAVNAAPNVEILSNNKGKSGIDIESNKEVIPKNIEQQQSPEAQKISSFDELVSLEKKMESPTIQVDSEPETVVDNKIGSLVEKQKELDRKQEELNDRKRIIEELKRKLDSAQIEINDKQAELDKRREDLNKMKGSMDDKRKDLDNTQQEIEAKKAQCQADILKRQKEFDEKKILQTNEQKAVMKVQADLDFDQKTKDRRQNLTIMNRKQLEADEKQLAIDQQLLIQQQQDLVSELNKLNSNKTSGTSTTESKPSELDSKQKNLEQKQNS